MSWQDDRRELSEVAPLAFAFGCALGCYWMLRGMKNAIFMDLVGPDWLPMAKMASIGLLVLLLMVYSQLVSWLGKRRLLFVIYAVYALLFAFLTYAFQHSGHHATLGWGFYLAIESFGSLGISHLWSLASNATKDPEVAARRFPMLAVGGQLGAVLCTALVVVGARSIGLAPLLQVAVVLLSAAPFMALRWLRANHVEDRVRSDNDKAGVVEGVRLVATRPYLLSILWIVVCYEFVGTFVDFLMNRAAKQHLDKLEDVTWFLATYGFAANVISLLFALTGTGFLVRRYGLSRCLAVYPLLLGLLVVVVAAAPGLWVFFAAQIALKGMAYGFNKPCLELLYVPCSDSIQFKAKSWIDTAGSRGGKALGSLMNANYSAALLMWGGMATCLTLLALWLPVAVRLGHRHANLVASREKLA